MRQLAGKNSTPAVKYRQHNKPDRLEKLSRRR
jgi:hypothetical protein